MKSTIRDCASFGYQTVNVGMEVDAVTQSQDYGHNTRHNLKACRCVQEFHKYAHCRETERIEELSLKKKEKTQHLGHGEDNLAVLLLKTILVFTKEALKIIKEHPVKHRVFRMTLPVNPSHGREDDS